MSEGKLQGCARNALAWTTSVVLVLTLVCAPKTYAFATDSEDEVATSGYVANEQNATTDAVPDAQGADGEESNTGSEDAAQQIGDNNEDETRSSAAEEAENCLDSEDDDDRASETAEQNERKDSWLHRGEPFGTDVGYVRETQSPVPYITKEGENALCTSYVVLSSSAADVILADGVWYVASEDVLLERRVYVAGSAHLILCDGATLTASDGVELNEGNSLTIYAQSEGDEAGILVATSTSQYEAGIGGGSENGCAGELVVCGGTIWATGNFGAGIGGGGVEQDGACDGGAVTVVRGTIDATGSHAAGIGGGYAPYGTSNGPSLLVQGGTVSARGDAGCAGIGGGVNGGGGIASIAGGAVVTSIGGANAPGIGGGLDGADAIVSIDPDARVTVQAGTSAESNLLARAAESDGDVSLTSVFDPQPNAERLFTKPDKDLPGSNDSSREEKAKDGRPSIANASVALATKTFVYNGKSKRPAVTVTMGGRILDPNVDYLTTYARNVNAGRAEVTVTGKGSYTGKQVVEFRIAPVCFSVQPMEDQPYTGKGILAMPTVTSGSKTLALGLDYTLQWKNNVRVGTATVIVKGKGNYAGSRRASFNIVESSADSSEGNSFDR